MQWLKQLGIRCVLLTSGTLSPLDSLAAELRLPFPVRLENPHVIDPKRVWVGVITSGPGNVSFNSTFGQRDRPVRCLAVVLHSLSRHLPVLRQYQHVCCSKMQELLLTCGALSAFVWVQVAYFVIYYLLFVIYSSLSIFSCAPC